MNRRKEKLLKLVIDRYIETAEPIGSKLLVQDGKLEVSGATIRNELRDLEEYGYLTHPHTSAGRIPTDAGYRYYVEKLTKQKQPAKKILGFLDSINQEIVEAREKAKQLAKFVAEQSGNAVIVAFNKNSLYYTGISHLFSQPEFRDYASTVSMSTVIDQCEERLMDVFDNVGLRDIKILIGEDNPLGTNCSTIVSRFGVDSLFVVLGPMRMNYIKNLGLINYIHNIL
jgi:heat-inducible transcriptional repressor